MNKFEYLPITYKSVDNPAQMKLFHGSRGGAKTTTLLADYAKHLNCGYGRLYKGILYRTNYDDLSEVKARAIEIFCSYYGAKAVGSKPMVVTFPQGETLTFSIMAHERQARTLVGKEYAWVGFDELSMLEDQEVLTNILSSNRTTLPIYSRFSATTNPWGAGRDWIKKVFQISENKSETIFINEYGKYCSHIFSDLTDNPYILGGKDGIPYLTSLSLFSEAKKQAWCFGNWNFVVGGFLEAAWSPEHQVLYPFRVPQQWQCFRSFDWGYSSPFAVGYYLISDGSSYTNSQGNMVQTIAGDIFKIYEIYGGKFKSKLTSKKIGLEWTNTAIADKIKEVDGYLYKQLGINVSGGIADDQIFAEKNNNNIDKQFRSRGIRFKPADKSSRVNSASLLIDLLTGAIPKNGIRENAGFFIWDNCQDTIRTLPQLQRCPLKLEDIDQRLKQEDHAFDESRYACTFANSKFSSNISSYFTI